MNKILINLVKVTIVILSIYCLILFTDYLILSNWNYFYNSTDVMKVLWNGRYKIIKNYKNVTLCDTSITNWCLQDYILSQQIENNTIYIYFSSFNYDNLNNSKSDLAKYKNIDWNLWYYLFWNDKPYYTDNFYKIPVFLKLNYKTNQLTLYWINDLIEDKHDRLIFKYLKDNPILIINWKQYFHYNYNFD